MKNVIKSVNGAIINSIPYPSEDMIKIFILSNLFEKIAAIIRPKAFMIINIATNIASKVKYSSPYLLKIHGSTGYSYILSE